MSKLNFTRNEVYADYEDSPKSYTTDLLQDWLAMYDLLKKIASDGWVEIDSNGYAEITLPAETYKKLKELIGGE